jgi:hypothetical protein
VEIALRDLAVDFLREGPPAGLQALEQSLNCISHRRRLTFSGATILHLPAADLRLANGRSANGGFRILEIHATHRAKMPPLSDTCAYK